MSTTDTGVTGPVVAGPLAIVPAEAPGVEVEVAAHEPVLFDVAPYAAPTFDGQRSDKLVIAFSGSITYEADDPAAQEMFSKLELGQEPTLMVTALVAQKAGKFAINAESTETVTGVATLKVVNLYLPSPEELR